jgi:hypothetical protein
LFELGRHGGIRQGREKVDCLPYASRGKDGVFVRSSMPVTMRAWR